MSLGCCPPRGPKSNEDLGAGQGPRPWVTSVAQAWTAPSGGASGHGQPHLALPLLPHLPHVFSQVVEDTGGLCPSAVLHPTKGGPDNVLRKPQVAQAGCPGPQRPV